MGNTSSPFSPLLCTLTPCYEVLKHSQLSRNDCRPIRGGGTELVQGVSRDTKQGTGSSSPLSSGTTNGTPLWLKGISSLQSGQWTR